MKVKIVNIKSWRMWYKGYLGKTIEVEDTPVSCKVLGHSIPMRIYHYKLTSEQCKEMNLKHNCYYVRASDCVEIEEESPLTVIPESYCVSKNGIELISADAIYGEPDFWDSVSYEQAELILYVLKNMPRDKVDDLIEVIEKCIELHKEEV